SRFVIHTVGPVWSGWRQNEPELLRSCYESSLRLAEKHELESIAFPAISCGVYGYPITQAASIAISTVRAFGQTAIKLERVVFACFGDDVFNALAKLV
ncbi:MAG: macro domain-containing protein, partial [Pseudomonadales bacterium]|nr:macro domain-containing protein [Pseudomonadales bacterium]